MKPYLSFFGCLLAILMCVPQLASAQKQPTVEKTTTVKRQVTTKATAKKEISDKDRQAIMELFKGVDPSKYRLQFDNKRTVAGRRSVSMNDLNQVKKVTNPVEAAGWIVFVVEGDDVIYVLAVGSDQLQSVLGKSKTARLNQIMAKYQ